MKDKLEELADEFDVDLEDTEAIEQAETPVDGIDTEAREATVIKPFQHGDGFVKDETHNYVLENGDQFSLTVKQRPECPSCKHVLAEPDEPNQLAGECSVCGKQTCYRNQSKCEACDKIFCPEHAQGHGLKDNPYCSDCLKDVDEDIEFDRGLELDKHEHKKKLEQFDKALKARKADAELVESIRKQRFKEAKEAYKLKLDTAKVINSSRKQSKKKADNSDLRKAAGRMRNHGFKRRDQR